MATAKDPSHHSRHHQHQQHHRKLQPLPPTPTTQSPSKDKQWVSVFTERDIPDISQAATCRCSACKSLAKLPHNNSTPTSSTSSSSSTHQHGAGVRIGDRVVISEDRTGVVRWIGQLDSDYVSSTTFFGVQLDDPLGQHNGVFKGKRYFTCPDNHGVFVPLTEIVYVKSRLELLYRPIGQQHTKRRQNQLDPLTSTGEHPTILTPSYHSLSPSFTSQQLQQQQQQFDYETKAVRQAISVMSGPSTTTNVTQDEKLSRLQPFSTNSQNDIASGTTPSRITLQRLREAHRRGEEYVRHQRELEAYEQMQMQQEQEEERKLKQAIEERQLLEEQETLERLRIEQETAARTDRQRSRYHNLGDGAGAGGAGAGSGAGAGGAGASGGDGKGEPLMAGMGVDLKTLAVIEAAVRAETERLRNQMRNTPSSHKMS